MKYPSASRADPVEPYGTTAEFAAKNLVKPQTVRKQLCQTGSYFGTKPKKLVNGRLSVASFSTALPIQQFLFLGKGAKK